MFKKKVFAKHLDNLLFILITFLRIPRTLVSLNIAELEYTVTVLLQTPRTDSLFCFPKLKILSWNNALILCMREKPSWNTNYQWSTTMHHPWNHSRYTVHVVLCYVLHRRVCQLFGQCMTTQVTHKHSATCCIISYQHSWASLNENLAAEER